MAKKFLSPLNLLNLTADPGTATEGDIYWNSTDNKLRVYYNGAWADASGGAGSGTVTSVATGTGLTGGTITTTGTLSIDTSIVPQLSSANTFTNNQLISANTSGNAVEIRQIGAGNALVVEDDTNPDSSPTLITATGQMIMGHTAALTISGQGGNEYLQINGTGTSAGTSQARWSNNNGGPVYTFFKSRSGTVGTFTTVVDDDILGRINFNAADGTTYQSGASILGEVDGTVSSGIVPGRLRFFTSNTSGTNDERMRLDSAGQVGIGTTSMLGILHTSTAATSNIFFDSYSSAPSSIIQRTARGTPASPTAIQSGDAIGGWFGRGYGSTSALFSAASTVGISFIAAENFTDSTAATNITFATTPTGSTTRSERMRIDSSGNVGIGVTPTTKLDVLGGSIQVRAAATQDGILLTGRAGGTSSWDVIFTPTTLTADRTITLPDASGTLALTSNLSSYAQLAGATFTGQIISTDTYDANTGGGQIYLNAATGNRIDFNTNGVAAPAFTTRSAGTKIVLYPSISATNTDYALGIESGTLWFAVDQVSSRQFKWYGGTTLAATLTGAGAFSAVTKSFDIEHPTKENMRLRYGSLEGPENGVYVRGKSKEDIIELPDYWTGLVDADSITVSITPIGKKQDIYVDKIEDNKVYLGGKIKEYFFTIFAERKDVDKLTVEY